MTSFGGVLSSNKGIGPGFDFLRVSLALSIVYFHAFHVTNQYYPLDQTSPFWLVHYTLVPMFFALSGFLVTASAGRLSLGNFLLNRSFRIIPALAVDTLVCALLIGPIFTKMDLKQYFSDSQLPTYFLNIIGYVHYNLPGVFLDLPIARVNGSLWTVPFELACYALMSILIVMNLLKSKWFSVGLACSYLITSAMIVHFDLLRMIDQPGLRRMFSIAFVEPEAQAVTAFLVGVIAFQFKDKIPYSRKLFIACIAFDLIIAFALNDNQGLHPAMRFVLMPIIVYQTIFIGLTNVPVPGFFRTGDYSYGIYLYHQPFLQIMVVLFPGIAFSPHIGATFTFVAALPLIIAVSWLSWHVVEKPSLQLRKRLRTTQSYNGALPRTYPLDTAA